MSRLSGPGSELKRLLAGWPFRISNLPSCNCNQVADLMDAWGPDECEKPDRLGYVVAVMKQNAKARGLPFIDAIGRMLVRRAIRNARKLTNAAAPGKSNV